MANRIIGNRYRYKSSTCRVLAGKRDRFGRVFVYWEGEYSTNWVDVKSSAYTYIDNTRAAPGANEPQGNLSVDTFNDI